MTGYQTTTLLWETLLQSFIAEQPPNAIPRFLWLVTSTTALTGLPPVARRGVGPFQQCAPVTSWPSFSVARAMGPRLGWTGFHCARGAGSQESKSTQVYIRCALPSLLPKVQHSILQERREPQYGDSWSDFRGSKTACPPLVSANQPHNFHATVLRCWRDVQEDYVAAITKATGRAHR